MREEGFDLQINMISISYRRSGRGILWTDKAHRALVAEALVFEQRVCVDTRFYFSAQCAEFVPLGRSL